MFNKILITISLILMSVIYSFSQNHIEALRYSQQFYSVTAKSDAMGNSLSAVGADMSALTINPAGIAVFKSSQFTFTPNFIISNTKGSFSGSVRNESKFGMNVSNIGYAGVMNLSGPVKNISIGMSYNATNDFRQRTVVSAENQQGSLLDYMVYNANIDRYSDFREDLAYRGWLLNYDDGAGEYFSFVTDDGTYNISQRKEVRTRGGMGEFDLSIGANIGDMLYIGTSIGITSVNYKEVSRLIETNFPLIYAENADIPGDSLLANPNIIEYEQTLYSDGSGVNAKVGMIFQPLKFLRIGAAFHSPTLYDFTEDYSAEMYIKYPVADASGYYDYSPDKANIFDWRLTTPFRANAGVAFILDSYPLGKFFTVPMIFSIDYEYVDYSLARLRTDYYSDYNFDYENDDIGNMYKETHNIRAGAEFNFGAVKLRGGYALYSSPYVNDVNLFDNAKVIYSGGIGFASKHAFLDLSYSYSPTSSTMYLYNATDIYPDDPMGNMTEPSASINNNKQFIKITMGLKF